MNRLLLIGVLLAGLGMTACDAEAESEYQAGVEARNAAIAASAVPASEPAQRKAPDNSEAELLIGMAKQQQAMAKRGKAQIDLACRVDNEIAQQIVRDAHAANDAWMAMKATDYVKIQRNACLNAVDDVRGLAYNCAADEFNTYWAATVDRHYAEDIALCDELIDDPPPLELTQRVLAGE